MHSQSASGCRLFARLPSVLHWVVVLPAPRNVPKSAPPVYSFQAVNSRSADLGEASNDAHVGTNCLQCDGVLQPYHVAHANVRKLGAGIRCR